MDYRIGVLALLVAQAAITSALPPCVCGRNLRPVCGSDGKTYANECKLDCEVYKGKTDLVMSKTGPCPDDGASTVIQVAIPTCVCTLEYRPVCGSDGVTYPNSCAALKCKTDVQVAYEGQCTPPCICTDELDFVCGTNGETYTSPCNLNCATAKDNTLGIKHKGRCVDAVKVVDISLPPPCTCARDMKPVCGSNGVTYNNDCLLNCATANDNTLSIKHEGKCFEDIVSIQAPCTCTRNLEPVCGADGVTYNNKCLLECAGQSLAKPAAC